MGDIEKPGEYEYRPGLSILQSISLAGGLLRGEEGAAAQVRRDLITTQGDLNVFDNGSAFCWHEKRALKPK